MLPVVTFAWRGSRAGRLPVCGVQMTGVDLALCLPRGENTSATFGKGVAAHRTSEPLPRVEVDALEGGAVVAGGEQERVTVDFLLGGAVQHVQGALVVDESADAAAGT